MQPISPGFRPAAVSTKRSIAARRTSLAIVGTGWRSSICTAWVRGEGAAPYPLREGGQDHALGLAIEQALATGSRTTVRVQPWA